MRDQIVKAFSADEIRGPGNLFMTFGNKLKSFGTKSGLLIAQWLIVRRDL